MLGKWIKRILGLLAVVAVAGAIVYALIPAPIGVDTAVIGRGPLEVTVDEEGVAQIRDVFRVSAPIAGKLNRIPVRVGDAVSPEGAPVASIQPAEPSLLDVRTRQELQAAVDAAEAAVGLAQAQVTSAEANEKLTSSDLDRARRLADKGAISARDLEKAATDLDTAHAAVDQAKANLVLRQSELASAEAKLIQPGGPAAAGGSAGVPVMSPTNGVVLKLLVESEQVVAAGTPLIEVGDPKDMEVVVHLLSSDAVGIGAGAPATLTEWGGDKPLNASVRRIDPAAYTKVSALGVEEQRVDATLDISDPYAVWRGLGHEYRVMAHIRTWKGADVVKVPVGALFRRGADWNVFRVVEGKAALTRVLLGHRNSHDAEVLSGVAQRDTVVLHPSDQVKDGISVAPRPDESSGG